jgi:PilZ domain
MESGRSTFIERRASSRSRCLFGARVALKGQSSTLDCVLRNHSEGGALASFSQAVALAAELDIIVEPHRVATPVQVVWRDGARIGLAFAQPGGLEAMKRAAAERLDGLRTERRAADVRSAAAY